MIRVNDVWKPLQFLPWGQQQSSDQHTKQWTHEAFMSKQLTIGKIKGIGISPSNFKWENHTWELPRAFFMHNIWHRTNPCLSLLEKLGCCRRQWIGPALFRFYQHLRFWWTCRKLLYLYSRPHLSQTNTLSSLGIMLLFPPYFCLRDFNLSAKRVIWDSKLALAASVLLGAAGEWLPPVTSMISWMATSSGFCCWWDSMTSWGNTSL